MQLSFDKRRSVDWCGGNSRKVGLTHIIRELNYYYNKKLRPWHTPQCLCVSLFYAHLRFHHELYHVIKVNMARVLMECQVSLIISFCSRIVVD